LRQYLIVQAAGFLAISFMISGWNQQNQRFI